MPITLSELDAAASKSSFVKVAASHRDARAHNKRVAFLSHSSQDKVKAKGLQVLLKEAGLDVYLYWEDGGMPEVPDSETADRVRRIVVASDFFLFLATPNSMTSRWCPWEIGYADGKKAHDRIYIIPTQDVTGKFYGNEYLQLYRRFDVADTGDVVMVKPRERVGTLLRNI